MNENSKYLVHLLSCHLNDTKPTPNKNIDWKKILKLSEIQNVVAIVMIEIKKMPKEYQPQNDVYSYFNQCLGYTIQLYETKIEGYNILVNTLCNNKIPHLILKGAQLRNYYPVKEARTSGDTDVIVKSLEIPSMLLQQNGFTHSQTSNSQVVLFYKDDEYEIKNQIDYVNEIQGNYFNDIFSSKCSYTENGYTYFLNNTQNLVYVTAHILGHLKVGGFGLRQLMDIDILLRQNNVDMDLYFKICKDINIEKSSKTIIALVNKLFDTPIDCDFKLSDDMYNMLMKIVLNGGTFGYGISNSGTIHLLNNSTNKKVTFFTSLKAFLSMFKSSKDMLYTRYPYCKKHHILLPMAYFNRIFEAMTKRRKASNTNIKTIFSGKDTVNKINQILNELDIKE